MTPAWDCLVSPHLGRQHDLNISVDRVAWPDKHQIKNLRKTIQQAVYDGRLGFPLLPPLHAPHPERKYRAP